MKRTKLVGIVCAGFILSSAAQALVFDKSTPEQKLRRDVTKQLGKYGKCLGKALRTCEKGTDPFSANCTLATEVVTGGGDAKSRFSADIDKCESKVDFLKKANGLTALAAYQSIGCPTGLADMTAYQNSVLAGLKVTVGQLGLLTSPVINECPADPDAEKCVDSIIQRLNKLTQGLAKCLDQCENDYTGSKGGGGDNDTTTLCAVALTLGTQAPEFFACTDKVFQKAVQKEPWPPTVFPSLVLPGVITDVNTGNNATYNSPTSCP